MLFHDVVSLTVFPADAVPQNFTVVSRWSTMPLSKIAGIHIFAETGERPRIMEKNMRMGRKRVPKGDRG